MSVGVAVAVIAPASLWYWRLHPARIAINDDPGRHGLAYDSIVFNASDGAAIHAWYLQTATPTARGIVIAPGIDNNRLQSGVTLALAPGLLKLGFDVIAIDLRGEGESGGEPITFGAREQWDVLAAVEQLRIRGARQVGVLGFSLGAVAAVLAAAGSDRIDAIAIDSAFADLRATFTHELAANYGLPPPAIAYGLGLYALLSGTDPASVSPVTVVGRIPPRHVLIIHGTADTAVPVEDSALLLRAAPGPQTSRWLVTGGTHTLSFFVDPAEYERRVTGFFVAAMPD